MYAKPDPKKLAFLKAQADALLAQAQKEREIEQAYREAITGQEAWLQYAEDDLLWAAHELGIDLTIEYRACA